MREVQLLSNEQRTRLKNAIHNGSMRTSWLILRGTILHPRTTTVITKDYSGVIEDNRG